MFLEMSDKFLEMVTGRGYASHINNFLKNLYKKKQKERLYDFIKGLGLSINEGNFLEELTDSKAKELMDHLSSKFAQEELDEFIDSALNSKSKIARIALGLFFTSCNSLGRKKELTDDERELITAFSQITDTQIKALLLTNKIYIQRDKIFYQKLGLDESKLNGLYLTHKEFTKNNIKYHEIGIINEDNLKILLQKFVYLNIFYASDTFRDNLGNDFIDLHATRITEKFLQYLEKANNFEEIKLNDE